MPRKKTQSRKRVSRKKASSGRSSRRSPYPRGICFMVMPYGEKSTGAKKPSKVHFDLLWDRALRPVIEELGYEAVRADQDLGPVIIQDMLERLVAADLVIADVTIPNANVFYEIGVRHAAQQYGCLLVGADWAKVPFDLEQIRRVPYPLGSQRVTAAGAKKIREALHGAIDKADRSKSPVHKLVPGYPDIDPERLGTFRDMVRELHQTQDRLADVREMTGKQRAVNLAELVAEYQKAPSRWPSVGLELLQMVRDHADGGDGKDGWQQTLDFIDELSDDLRDHEFVLEQEQLAWSKLGKHRRAIQSLNRLVREHGPTPERDGLLGGRYKALWRESGTSRHLDQAIDHYRAGMQRDLNSYYCSSNLPRLLRFRDAEGDRERAASVAHVVAEACEAAESNGRGDEWLYPTLLGAAFDAGNVYRAQCLLDRIRAADSKVRAKWKLSSTEEDLKTSLQFVRSTRDRKALDAVRKELRKLAT